MAKLHLLISIVLIAACRTFGSGLDGQQSIDCEDGKCASLDRKNILRGLAHRALLAIPKAPVCPAGEYLQLLQGQCKKCSPGRAKTNSGAGTCQPCKPGTYAEGEGSVECTPCPAGTTSTSTLPTTCNSCPAGTYAPEDGSTRCIPCFQNSISKAGATQCTRCPNGTGTNGKTGQTKCVPV